MAAQAKKYEKVNRDKIHLLSGILKCPVCGAGMYGNKSIKKRKDGSNYKDFYYYGCKHRTMTRGHKCEYRKQIREELVTMLAGRAAESIVFDSVTTGASNDIKRATSEARAMVTKYGMSDRIGLISYGDDDDEVFIGRDLAHTRGYSEDVAKAIDSEIHSIIEECHDNAKKIISEHMEVLHGCAKLLLEKEKVHRDEFEALFTMEKSGESNESI